MASSDNPRGLRSVGKYIRRALQGSALFVPIVLAGCGDDHAVAPADPIAQVPVNETVRLPGLGATTEVVVDELGIPHVFAPDVESALFVQGYVTAAARFWEMDAFRRSAEGRLSELFGRASLSADVGMRTVFTTRDGRRLEEALWEYLQNVDPEVARIFEAYAAGVNAWLADLRAGRNGVALPPEYGVAQYFGGAITAADLADWRPQDSVAIGRLEAWSLSETMETEIAFAKFIAVQPDAVVHDLLRFAPVAPATVLPVHAPANSSGARGLPSAAPPAVPAIADLDAILDGLDDLRRMSPLGSAGEFAGSNNWIVSPALSANGHAMLANDPHLPLLNPPIWHVIQLDAGGGAGAPVRENGVTFPGLPGLLLGHNEVGAWGGTVANFDVTDVYVETVYTPPDYPSSPRTVLFNGQQVPVLRLEETFRINSRPPVTEVIEVVPHHGPMVPDPNLKDDVVGLAATGMSFRWTGHEITDDFRTFLELARARTVADFRAALGHFATGAQNWVWADVHGDIAYFARALVPQRPPGTMPYLPLSGSGDAEWRTDAAGNMLWLPDDRLPQATNPAEGFLATANNDQFGHTLDNDPLNDDIYLGFSFDIGLREQRIQELLSNRANVRPAGAQMTPADLSRYQYDTASTEAARFLPFLFKAADNRPDLVTAEMAAALERLRAWGDDKADSPAYNAASGIDAHDLRDDVAPRGTPVTDEERADAIATSIFAAWQTRMAAAVLKGSLRTDFARTGVNATKPLLHILEDIDQTDPAFRVYTKGANGESTLWDDPATPQVETRDAVLLAALRDGLGFLRDKLQSSAPEDWLWGKLHQVRFQHFLGQAGLAIFDLTPFAAPGARSTVNPANYGITANDFIFSSGPSKRFVAVLDPAGIRAVSALPGGINGNPGGATSEIYNRINPALHYGDLVPGWLNGEPFDYHISHADVAAHALHKVRYTP